MKYAPMPSSLINLFEFKYDPWNRLIRITSAYSVNWSCEYDGLGRRINRTKLNSPYTAYDYYYNENWQLLEERQDGSSNPLNQYVWHPYFIDALAVRYWDSNLDGSYGGTNEGALFYMHDANFNVTAVANSSGTVLERYNYTPYGDVTFMDTSFAALGTQATTIGNTHLYTGRERDPETGLQLNRHRFYAPPLGRWVNRDPVEYTDGYNLYEYVADRPLIMTDVNGLEGMWPIIAKPRPCGSLAFYDGADGGTGGQFAMAPHFYCAAKALANRIADISTDRFGNPDASCCYNEIHIVDHGLCGAQQAGNQWLNKKDISKLCQMLCRGGTIRFWGWSVGSPNEHGFDDTNAIAQACPGATVKSCTKPVYAPTVEEGGFWRPFLKPCTKPDFVFQDRWWVCNGNQPNCSNWRTTGGAT